MELVEPVEAMDSLLREPFSGRCSEERAGEWRDSTSVVREVMYFWKRAPWGVGYTGCCCEEETPTFIIFLTTKKYLFLFF